MIFTNYLKTYFADKGGRRGSRACPCRHCPCRSPGGTARPVRWPVAVLCPRRPQTCCRCCGRTRGTFACDLFLYQVPSEFQEARDTNGEVSVATKVAVFSTQTVPPSLSHGCKADPEPESPSWPREVAALSVSCF